MNSDEGEGYIKIDAEKGEVYGYNPVHRIYNGNGKPAGLSGYFVARFDKPFTKTGVTFNLDKKYYPGKKFVLLATPNKQYGTFSIVKLNGKEIDPLLNHEDLQKGGKLEFVK